MKNIVVRLRQVPPAGPLAADTFDYGEEVIPDPGEGEFVVEVLYQSIDAGSRGSLDPNADYVLRITPGQKLFTSGTIGRVVDTRHAAFPEGAMVAFDGGTRQSYHKVNPARSRGVRVIEASDIPVEAQIGVLGLTGFTAWLGVFRICRPKAGETMLVSAAAGAVGSAAGQFSRLAGATVVGIAGGKEKCDHVRDVLRFDDCVDYRSQAFPSTLAESCPTGVDCYFENVGGAVQDAAFAIMKPFARVALCGLVAQYGGSGGGPAPSPNLMFAIDKRVTMTGFLASDHYALLGEFRAQVGQWMLQGQVHSSAHVVDGMHNLHHAINALIEGKNFGQTLHYIGS